MYGCAKKGIDKNGGKSQTDTYSLILPFFSYQAKIVNFLRRILPDLPQVGCVFLYFRKDSLLSGEQEDVHR